MVYVSKEKRDMILAYFAIFVLIFYSGSAYAAAVNSFYAQLKYLIILSIFFVFLIKSNGKIPLISKGRKFAIWIPTVWCSICLCSWLIHNDEGFNILLSRMLHIVLAYEIVCIVSWENFKTIYVKSIVFLCLVSLLFFFFLDKTSLFSILMPKLVGFTSTGIPYIKYQGFLFYFKTMDNSRNYGAFWEPGIFATHIICTYLLLPYLDIEKKIKNVISIILFITVLSTASSAGYVLFFIAFFCNFVSNFKFKKRFDYFKLFVVFAILILLIFIYFNLPSIIKMLSLDNEVVFEKLLHVSESERSDSIKVNLLSFYERPFFGFGFSNLYNSQAYEAFGKSFAVLDTATSFRLLAALGICGSFFTLILVIGILRQKTIPWFVKTFLVVIILVIINKEAHDSFLIAWCFALYMNEKHILQEEH